MTNSDISKEESKRRWEIIRQSALELKPIQVSLEGEFCVSVITSLCTNYLLAKRENKIILETVTVPFVFSLLAEISTQDSMLAIRLKTQAQGLKLLMEEGEKRLLELRDPDSELNKIIEGYIARGNEDRSQ